MTSYSPHRHLPSRFNPVDWSTVKPKILSAFFIDSAGNFYDSFVCRYLVKNSRMIPRLGFDLSEGMSTFVRKEEYEDINHILLNIRENFMDYRNKTDTYVDKSLRADIICSRELLLQIMNSAYDYHEPWTILGTRFRGSIYLCNKLTDQKRREIASRPPAEWEKLAYDHKLKHLLFAGKAL